jgi:hypothetical protein
MAVWVFLVTVCAVAIPFYLRFLVALCQEFRFARIGLLVRVKPTANDDSMVESATGETTSPRAA